MLLSIAKLQNLKAIHNQCFLYIIFVKVVINRKTTKFESNSQLVIIFFVGTRVVINRKTTKFESNSQHPLSTPAVCSGCYQSQNYKI